MTLETATAITNASLVIGASTLAIMTIRALIRCVRIKTADNKLKKINFPFVEFGIALIIIVSVIAIATDDGFIHPQQQIVRATR